MQSRSQTIFESALLRWVFCQQSPAAQNIQTYCYGLVLLFCSLTSIARSDDFKLQPLRYNNPGLAVDLGVGLWAYPMPVDYDRDGDMDLLVGCPDKPSHGTYFFENPTQDPDIKMPIFEPGVRIGEGYHYMMLSQRGDQQVVMRPGVYYPRDASDGKFDFDSPIAINLPSDPGRQSKGRTRGNMWRFVDFDGDGDHDIAVGLGDWTELAWDHAYDRQGRWRNGPLHGYVYIVINEGTDAAPIYSNNPQRMRAAGREVDVYGWPSPNFADFDADGDLDLLCGEFLDGFTYFQNIGSRTQPEYAAGVRLRDHAGAPLVMDLQMITPTAVDWDADGDFDLIVGDEDGRVALVENVGLRDNVPLFREPKYFQQVADTLKFGALATPFAYDWDGDSDQDILCGCTAGYIGLFENLGSSENGLPKWAAPQRLNLRSDGEGEAPFRVLAGVNGSIQGPCEAKWGYTTLSVADWDRDGDGDIVYNSILGELGLLLNDSGTLVERTFDTGQQEFPPEWNWRQSPSSATLTQWRTTPMVLDFDEDERLDLVMLDQEGYLTLRSAGGPAQRIFVDEDSHPIRLNSGSCGRSGRIKLALVDWDRDSRLDLLTNSENATWYRNCETRDGKIVLKRIGNLARRNVAGHTSSPAVCDFNGDGAPDLLVGSENGRIYHIDHNQCVGFNPATLAARPAQERTAAKFEGFIDEEFVFTKAVFKECHASTICRTSRGLVAAWFGGTKEGNPDVGIWTSYHDGQKWSSPIEVANGMQHIAAGRAQETAASRYPCWNPVLYQSPGDGPTLLFFKVGPNPRQWWGEMMVSYDRGRTFVDRKRLPQGIDGPVRCKPILLGNEQTLLCGSSTEYDGWRVHFELVDLIAGLPSDLWTRVGPINNASTYNAIQPTLLTHADGRIQSLSRTKESVIVSSTSADNGRTWSKLEPTNLPNPNSGIDAVTLADRRHLLVYNPLPSGDDGWGRRSVLSLAISHDGLQWETVAELERHEQGEFSYPAMIQTPDGRVHISYTWQRERIKHVVVDPTQFQAVSQRR